MFTFLLGTRLVAVDELAAELERRTVGPVFGQFEGRIDPYDKLILILEPHAVAHRFVLRVRRLHLHAVVTQFGRSLRLNREEVFLKQMPQVERGDQRNRVITARYGDPWIVIGGQRALQSCTDFQIIALLADGGTLGLVTGQTEIVDIH